MNPEAIKDLLYRLADDELIIGHRMSEWTALGPILEEDIAFSSMAQDEIGHAQAYYILLHELLEEAEPDTIAFTRHSTAFRSCTLVEQPIGDYAFSLVRHALYDLAEEVRLESLSKSSFRPLAELAKKLAREERYHQMHAVIWLKQLGNSTPEAKSRLQAALDQAVPLAYGLFEPTALDATIAEAGLQATEAELEAAWESNIRQLIADSGLLFPEVADKTAAYGGRQGKHTEHLQPLLDEMSEVFVIDPLAAW